MTVSEFRRLALSLPEAVEQAHMGHPDFRVGGKVFATLFRRDDADWGMVKVPPDRQRVLLKQHPGQFAPAPGAWGRQGCTTFRLAKAKKIVIRGALLEAWQGTAPKRLTDGPDGITFVALLRGINVGGKNKLPMKTLARLFEKAGCTNVRTYIQSGNVVFTAPAGRSRAAKGARRSASGAQSDAAALASRISRRIADDTNLRVPVVLRTADELRKTVESNPFLKRGADTKSLGVAFLADQPDRRNAALLDAKRSPGDSFAIKGRDIFLHLPNGVARTKLTNDYFDSTLETTCTVRNWRTVLKLLELSDAEP